MKRKRYRYLFLVLCVILNSCDFLGIGGDNGDNPPDETFSLAWQQQLPSNGGNADPVIENGSVYVLGLALARLDLQTGDATWQAPLGNSSTPASTENGNLLLADESVIVSQNTTVQSFSKADGQQLWQTSVGSQSDSGDPTAAATRRPLAQTSSRVFVGTQNNVTGLNKSSGATELNIALNAFAPQGATQQVTSLAASNNEANPLVFVAAQYDVNKTEFLSKGNLAAINAKTGETVWVTGITDIVADSTAADEIVASDLAIAGNLLVVLTTTEVVALEPNSGNIVWQTSLNGGATALGQSHIVVDRKALFVNTIEGTALRLNADDGSIVWQTKIGNNLSVGISGGLALGGGQLYNPIFGFEGAGIRVLDTADGTIEKNITGKDVEGVSFDFDFLGGIAVSDEILVRQGAINTYGVEL